MGFQGRITYTKLTVPSGKSSDVAAFLGYEENGREWYVYSFKFYSETIGERFAESGMQVYRPTYQIVDRSPKHPKVVNRPKILNYVFVLATAAQVASFSKTYEINPIYRHRSKSEWEESERNLARWNASVEKLKKDAFTLRDSIASAQEASSELATKSSNADRSLVEAIKARPEQYRSMWQTIPPKQMHSLMIVAEQMEATLEFCTPGEEQLEKGDRVRVAAGDFAGAEGILMTSQGIRSGGKVYVGITNAEGVLTATIPDENLQVLEFSRKNNHFTRKLQAAEKQLESILADRQAYGTISDEQRAYLEFFVFRYALLGNLTLLNECKIETCRYVAKTLLGRSEEANGSMDSFLAKNEKDPSRRESLRRYPSATEYMNRWKSSLDKALSGKN